MALASSAVSRSDSRIMTVFRSKSETADATNAALLDARDKLLRTVKKEVSRSGFTGCHSCRSASFYLFFSRFRKHLFLLGRVGVRKRAQPFVFFINPATRRRIWSWECPTGVREFRARTSTDPATFFFAVSTSSECAHMRCRFREHPYQYEWQKNNGPFRHLQKCRDLNGALARSGMRRVR